MRLLKMILVSSLFISIFSVVPVFADGIPDAETGNVEPKKVDIPEPKMGEPEEKKPKSDEAEEIVELEIETPASVTGEKMEGNGTVVDFSTSGSKAFYTIVDSEQQVFYLVIDMDKTDNNVYFLSDINKSELEGVAPEQDSGLPVPAPEQDVEAEQAEEPKESGNGFVIFLLVASVIFIAAYYFLVIKKKQGQKNNDDEDEDEDDMMNDNYEDDMIVEETRVQDNKDDN